MAGTLRIVLGSGGTARETFWVVHESLPGARVIFAEREAATGEVEAAGTSIRVIRDYSELTDEERAQARFSAAINEPRAKYRAVQHALEAGLKPAEPLISPHAIVRADAVLGLGTVIHARGYVSTNVRIGDFVSMLPMGGVAHDVTVGDYATCEALGTTAGYATLQCGVHVKAGAAVRQFLTVAPWVTIEHQACVVSDITDEGITVAGVPAKPVTPNAHPA